MEKFIVQINKLFGKYSELTTEQMFDKMNANKC